MAASPRLADPLPIPPLDPDRPFDLTVPIPGSKSLTNRALLVAALARGESTLTAALDSDDTSVMIAALGELGCPCRADVPDQPNPDQPGPDAGLTVRVRGTAGRWPADQADLFLGNAGTAMRFLAAATNLGSDDGPFDYDGNPNPRPGRYRLRGIERMHQRPIGQLVDALRRLGADVRYTATEGCPPLEIHTRERGPIRGGELTLEPTLSSQYVSALLIVGPYLRADGDVGGDGLALRFNGPVTSESYVRMTLAVMHAFGVEARVEQTDAGLAAVHVPPGHYTGRTFAIEPDASSASYFLAAAALTPGARVRVEGVGRHSTQGDARFANLLQQMGARVDLVDDATTVHGTGTLRAIDADLASMPDMAQTLAALAALADPASGPTTLRGVSNLRVKETDRIAALQAELRKLGVRLDVSADGEDLTLTPPADIRATVRDAVAQRGGPIEIDTYDDHRMAMAFALPALMLAGPDGGPAIAIREPGCVSKTFPGFFHRWARLHAG